MRKLLKVAAVTAALAAPTLIASPPAQAFCCPVFAWNRADCQRLQSEYDRYYTITLTCRETTSAGITRWMFAYRA